MSIRLRLALAVLTIASISASSQQAPLVTPGQPQPAPQSAPRSHWPAREGVYRLQQFRFGSGEMLPELRLNYLTLGTRTAMPKVM